MFHYNHVIHVHVFQSNGNAQSYVIPDFWTRTREKQEVPQTLKICRLSKANIQPYLLAANEEYLTSELKLSSA